HGRCAPVAGSQTEIERLVSCFSGRCGRRGHQRGAVAGEDLAELEPARSALRQIVVEPIGERCVEINNVTILVDGEKTRRRVIEIIDRMLQFLENILLTLALARYISD